MDAETSPLAKILPRKSFLDLKRPTNVMWIPPSAGLPAKPPPPALPSTSIAISTQLGISQNEDSRAPGSSSTSSRSPMSGSKRKAEEEADGGSSLPSLFDDQTKAESTLNDIKTETPTSASTHHDVPLLSAPIPSKRFRRNPLRKGTLLPIEQIPPYPLPPLPIIDNPALLKQVFTHQSLFKHVKGKFEDTEDDLPKHYEKLEHVGDSLLGMVVTTWLHEIKPGLTPGTATQLKAHLVSNATLSHISGMYGLPQRMNADPNLLPLLRVTTDVRAALMESYIAGVYVSFPPSERYTKGLGVITNWLKEMYDPLVDFFYNHMKKEHDQHSNAIGSDMEGNVIVMDPEEIAKIDERARGMLPLLKMHCKAYERDLKFEEYRFDTEVGALFQMKCLVDGMELGEATRAGKNQAKEVAAWEAAKKLDLAEY